MRYYRLVTPDGERRLVVETGPDDLEDLTSVEHELLDVQDLAFAASLSGDNIDHIAQMVLESGECEQYSLSKVMEYEKDVPGGWQVDLPLILPKYGRQELHIKTVN
mgnify:CR=1 FL=1